MNNATTETTIETTAAKLLPGDIIAGTAGGAAFTVSSVDSFAGMVIVDFADGTASPPVKNHRMRVIRKR
jgi:hypothetical protein